VEYGYLYSEDRSRKDEIDERTTNKESSTGTDWPRGNREMRGLPRDRIAVVDHGSTASDWQKPMSAAAK
jgi:hypothetical protein